ncbi:MAG TPA: DUF5691 domain-containing protein [Actinophytocola sp.]|uniref:DUF5691 domain-containing protein n=1 Tax=Actinophytocola sp. TaxID=1872138 RepID=UPI002DB7BB87|nr:DUF5691 domain-containing protein [Actinophytocola sp.]HEU5471428.1 DUF5691 domain-containing protein [Actinophytocola sp.]
MKEWEALVSVALLGTTRRGVDAVALPEPVRRLANAAGGADPERTLLAAAALLAGYRKAGRRPLDGELSRLSPAPADHRELVGPAARHRLSMLLGGEHLHLLPEWLAAVAARGLRVPPERLPLLADAARGRPELRGPVTAAAGPRGPWLADLRPEWSFLAESTEPGDDPRVWRFGTIAARHVWLVALRDNDPDAARAALEEVWTAEPAPVRVQFLTVLRTALSISDEQFLERALDDRAKDVRRLAAELLAELPDSALSQRMAARLRPLVAVRGRVLQVRLPDGCDAAMQRDGIAANPPDGVGRRAWWLGQLVSTAPLSVWTGLGVRPDKLVRMRVEGCDPRLLTLGWAAAAVRERAADWVAALLDDDTTIAVDQVAAMIAVLPESQWASVIARLTRQRLITGLFLGLPRPWPVEVGNLVLDRLAGHRDERAAVHVADVAGRAVPRECLDHPLATQPLEDGASPWRRRLVETLVFRREMHKELP